MLFHRPLPLTIRLYVLPLLFVFGLVTELTAQRFKEVNPFATVDAIALSLPDSLSRSTEEIAGFLAQSLATDRERVRGIFIWLSKNIVYDVDEIYTYRMHELGDDLCTETLVSRKGICENYAAIFDAVCTHLGLRSAVIPGYNRQDGRLGYLSHAWCTVKLDSTWHLFDPTWAAGYVQNNKFYAKYNPDYYDPTPDSMLKTHMPFDAIWQLKTAIMTFPEFDRGVQQASSTTYFNYLDSIENHIEKDLLDRTIATVRRIDGNGKPNALVYNYAKDQKNYVTYVEQERLVNAYNLASLNINEAVSLYNDYINLKNARFIKLSDQEIQAALNGSKSLLAASKAAVADMPLPSDATSQTWVRQYREHSSDLEKLIQSEQSWLNEFFSKSKLGRTGMFYQ